MECEEAGDGQAGLDRLHAGLPFDLAFVDWNMPVMNGLEMVKSLRAEGFESVKVMMVTTEAENDYIVRALEAGADDYLTKPFSFDVLLARIRARTRKAGQKNSQLRFADLTLDLEEHKAWRGKRAIVLTRTEFAILECLLQSAGRVVTRDRLVETVWSDREVSENNLDVFIRFLRSKIDVPGSAKLIHTERGLGYSLRQEPE